MSEASSTSASPEREVLLDADGLPVPDPDFHTKRKAALMAYFQSAADGIPIDMVDEPNMFATDPGFFRDLSARIPGLLVHSAGEMMPFQSDGTLCGLPYYFRFRSGHASLRLSHPDTNGSSFEHLYSAGMGYGDEYAGALTRAEFCDLMVALVPQLERAPFLWEFAGVKVRIEDIANPGAGIRHTGRPERGQRPARVDPAARKPPVLQFTATDVVEVYRAWGRTPAEARARLHEPSTYLVEHGWSVEDQSECDRLKAIDSTPLNADLRVYPSSEPVFTVRDA